MKKAGMKPRRQEPQRDLQRLEEEKWREEDQDNG